MSEQEEQEKRLKALTDEASEQYAAYVNAAIVWARAMTVDYKNAVEILLGKDFTSSIDEMSNNTSRPADILFVSTMIQIGELLRKRQVDAAKTIIEKLGAAVRCLGETERGEEKREGFLGAARIAIRQLRSAATLLGDHHGGEYDCAMMTMADNQQELLSLVKRIAWSVRTQD